MEESMKENMKENMKERLRIVDERITEACLKSSRKKEDVKLIAVSKTKPIDDIRHAINLGLFEFGENKPQELAWKYDEISNVKWHLIGHLQRNKVKMIINKACLIHSVDTLRLAEEINNEAIKLNIDPKILIEVNVSGEETKDGVRPEELYDILNEMSVLSNIKVKGLMTVAPYTENPENNRDYFKRLHEIYVDIRSKNIDNICMEELSMGMTGDYRIAIEEGATMVRIGTGIFGERVYNI